MCDGIYICATRRNNGEKYEQIVITYAKQLFVFKFKKINTRRGEVTFDLFLNPIDGVTEIFQNIKRYGVTVIAEKNKFKLVNTFGRWKGHPVPTIHCSKVNNSIDFHSYPGFSSIDFLNLDYTTDVNYHDILDNRVSVVDYDSYNSTVSTTGDMTYYSGVDYTAPVSLTPLNVLDYVDAFTFEYKTGTPVLEGVAVVPLMSMTFKYNGDINEYSNDQIFNVNVSLELNDTSTDTYIDQFPVNMFGERGVCGNVIDLDCFLQIPHKIETFK
jgi:hypothetical protein